MKVIDAVTITAAMLTSSTVAEPSGSDPAAWDSGTTYALGGFAYLAATHRVYQSIQAGNLNHDPATDTALATPLWWKDYGPTNKWAMFDTGVSTQSSVASPLTVVLHPGSVVGALALIEMVGTQAVITMKDAPGGASVYSKTVNLEGSVVADWYQYFFEPFLQLGTLVIIDLPPYLDGEITVSITGTGTVKCGGCIVGALYPLGTTEYGVQAGILDYSKKAVDATTGVVSISVGKYRKFMRGNFIVETESINKTQSVLEGLRASPSMWLGDNSAGYSPLLVYGFLRDFKLDLTGPATSSYSFEIEGML